MSTKLKILKEKKKETRKLNKKNWAYINYALFIKT